MEKRLFALHQLQFTRTNNTSGTYKVPVVLNLRSSAHLSEHGFFSKVPKLSRLVKYLDGFQGRAMKVIKDLKANTFERRLKDQELLLL